MSDPRYDTLVVATDLSDPSLGAMRHAAWLADRLGSRLVVTYVMEDNIPAAIVAHSSETEEQLLARHRKHAKKSLDEFVERYLIGHDVECVVREGVDHQQITALAREREAGLIVIGMHGHGFLVHALSGSTAERVLHHAPCPVLVVSHESESA